MKHAYLIFLAIIAGLGGTVLAQERIELESIYVKGNKEFPQTLYVVPWKEVKGKDRDEQPLVLHSLFGDLFDPVYADGDQAPSGRQSKLP